MDFAIIIQQMVNYFMKICEIEMVFAGVTFTFGSAFVWIALIGVVAMFWKSMRGE